MEYGKQTMKKAAMVLASMARELTASVNISNIVSAGENLDVLDGVTSSFEMINDAIFKDSVGKNKYKWYEFWKWMFNSYNPNVISSDIMTYLAGDQYPRIVKQINTVYENYSDIEEGSMRLLGNRISRMDYEKLCSEYDLWIKYKLVAQKSKKICSDASVYFNGISSRCDDFFNQYREMAQINSIFLKNAIMSLKTESKNVFSELNTIDFSEIITACNTVIGKIEIQMENDAKKDNIKKEDSEIKEEKEKHISEQMMKDMLQKIEENILKKISEQDPGVSKQDLEKWKNQITEEFDKKLNADIEASNGIVTTMTQLLQSTLRNNNSNLNNKQIANVVQKTTNEVVDDTMQNFELISEFEAPTALREFLQHNLLLEGTQINTSDDDTSDEIKPNEVADRIQNQDYKNIISNLQKQLQLLDSYVGKCNADKNNSKIKTDKKTIDKKIQSSNSLNGAIKLLMKMIIELDFLKGNVEDDKKNHYNLFVNDQVLYSRGTYGLEKIIGSPFIQAGNKKFNIFDFIPEQSIDSLTNKELTSLKYGGTMSIYSKDKNSIPDFNRTVDEYLSYIDDSLTKLGENKMDLCKKSIDALGL